MATASKISFFTTNAEEPDEIHSKGWQKQGIQEILHDQNKAQLGHNTDNQYWAITNCNWKQGPLDDISSRERHCLFWGVA